MYMCNVYKIAWFKSALYYTAWNVEHHIYKTKTIQLPEKCG